MDEVPFLGVRCNERAQTVVNRHDLFPRDLTFYENMKVENTHTC